MGCPCIKSVHLKRKYIFVIMLSSTKSIKNENKIMNYFHTEKLNISLSFKYSKAEISVSRYEELNLELHTIWQMNVNNTEEDFI